MNKRYLLLFTDFYPFPGWETYLQPEMKFLSAQFERIFIFSNHQTEGALVPELPPNVEAFFISPHISFPEKLGSLRFFFSKLFWDEIKCVRKQYSLRVNISIIKIALVSHWHANRYKKRIEDFLQERNLHKQDIFLYSYWADYRAVAAAMLREKYGFTAITRAHGWDVYFERHPVPYLPFRKFISDRLSAIFFVSENGKNYFCTKVGENSIDKLRIARLAIGKNESNPQAKNSAFTIVSCARLVPLKRVNLIADILLQTDHLPVHWIHFGSGNNEETFRNEVQQKLSEKKNIRFDFRGETSHEELMEFYRANHVDLFLLTSEYEGMPFAIIEALSFGIPVMATNVGGISEAIHNDSGLLLEKDFDPAQAAKSITSFANQPPEKISAYRQTAFETWNSLFNAEKNFPEFIQCLLQLQPSKNKSRE